MDWRKIIFKRDWAKNYMLSLLAVLTILFFTSGAWNLVENRNDTIERARIEARTIFQHNLAYRRWNSMHGGVYAWVTDENQPNEYLFLPNRDIATMAGAELTMINPFRMTKQAYDLLSEQSPDLAPVNRTVSLEPLNPENEPDDWERVALHAFEQGRLEISEITEISGAPYMRLLTPYITEEGCLKCHGWQGYDIGDIRGAMSIAVPMRPYYESAASTQRIIVISHVLLWLLGVGTIVLFSNGLRKYRKAISESEEKFRIVSEFAHNFECWIKDKNEIVFISPSCERVTGYSRQEFMENPKLVFDIVHPEDRKIQKNHLASFTDAAHEEIEYRIVTKDGQVRWLSHTCSPIFIDGKFLGRRGSNRDITDKKQLEEQLLQSQKMECLGRFAGGIAHDFNNTLSSISTFTHLLQGELADCKTKGEVRDFLDYIFVATKLGKNLTSNLLAFGRKQVIDPRTVRLSAIINNISDILKTLITEDIECSINLEANEAPVFADPHQIEQVLFNLCTNARDAMPEGGRLEISTYRLKLLSEYAGTYGTVPPGEYMVVAVSDTGLGVSRDILPRICEPFFTTKQNSKCKGTGLGLSIISDIVKQHEGFIDVESAMAQGTTFRIFLRVSDESVESGRQTKEEGPPVTEGTNQTILVAEDDDLVRRSLNFLLKQKGYRVILAEDGEEAIEKYTAHKDLIDMVILDVVLPKKNGREVFSFIKHDSREAKVLFVSGYTDDIITEKGICEEGLEFLEKPIDAVKLIAKVRHILAPRPSA